jgi:hypothetical protein
MTVYCEDPHDSWHHALLAKDHSGRAQFWMAALAVLAVFWAAVAWAIVTAL